MPYSCARAICLTFAYPIRWALTPIFGPSFIKECLKPDHPGFARFKVEREVVRCAQLEVEGWKAVSRDGTPVSCMEGLNPAEIPRSMPEGNTIGGKQLRPRKDMPQFKTGSPFSATSSEDEDAPADPHCAQTPTPSSALETPAVSPKTKPMEAPARAFVNTPRRILPTSPRYPPTNTPNGSFSPLNPLLSGQIGYSPMTSWRAATPGNDNTAYSRKVHAPSQSRKPTPAPKRRLSIFDKDDDDAYVDNTTESSTSSDGEDMPQHGNKAKKQRRGNTPVNAAPSTPTPIMSSLRHDLADGQSQKYTATEARAAQWLLKLSLRDSQLAQAAGGVVGPGFGSGRGQKRRASVL